MRVESQHHVDASEPNSEGMHDYYYEYDTFLFSEADMTIAGRSYSDEPQRASLLNVTIGGTSRPLNKADLGHSLVLAAVGHFKSLGKTTIDWFGGSAGGYGPIA